MNVLLGIAGCGLGIYLIIKGNKMKKDVDRYEFENRTSGAVVEFTDYDSSQAHAKKKQWSMLTIQAGVIAFGLAVLYVFFG